MTPPQVKHAPPQRPLLALPGIADYYLKHKKSFLFIFLTFCPIKRRHQFWFWLNLITNDILCCFLGFEGAVWTSRNPERIMSCTH